MVWRTTAGFHAVIMPREEADDPRNTALQRALYHLFLSTQKWVDDPARPEVSRGFKQHWFSIYNDFRGGRQWFLGVELSVSIVVGVLNGIMNESLCDEIATAFLTLIGLQWLMAVVLRPFVAPFETLCHVLFSSITLLSSLLLVIGDYRDSDALRGASAYSALVGVVLSSLKSVLDVIALSRWFHTQYKHRGEKREIRKRAASAAKADFGEAIDEDRRSLDALFQFIDRMMKKLECCSRAHRTAETPHECQLVSSSTSSSDLTPVLAVAELKTTAVELAVEPPSPLLIPPPLEVRSSSRVAPRPQRAPRKPSRGPVMERVHLDALAETHTLLAAANDRLAQDLMRTSFEIDRVVSDGGLGVHGGGRSQALTEIVMFICSRASSGRGR